MNVTWYEKGRLEMLVEMIEVKFGPVPLAEREKIQRLTVKEIADLRNRVFEAQFLKELGLKHQ